jgi:hypothetical protein
MDTETTAAENALPEQEASRKSGKPPKIVMTSTTNFIRIQSDLEDHVNVQCKFRNRRSGTHIITKEMAEYSNMKCYLEENNPHYFTFSLNSENPVKAVIRHLLPDMPAENSSNSLEDLAFSVIYVTQVTVTRKRTQRTTPRRNSPSVSFYLNRKYKISRDIPAQYS